MMIHIDIYGWTLEAESGRPSQKCHCGAGPVMKSTGGKANPQAVNEVLKRKLGL